MKKTWIKVKRGLLDTKHRIKLDSNLFLYLFMLDKADWDTGIIFEWTDKGAALELDMPISTLRYQRRKLEDDQYIQTSQKKHCLQITITNWTNPREYSGQVYNRAEGDNILSPEKQDEEIKGDNKGYNKGYNKGDNPLSPVHRIPHNHITIIPEKIEPEREPCDFDGITESMELGYGGIKPPRKKLLSSSEHALAEFFSEYTGLKLPRAETKRDYSKMQVTWWKPIKAMLYEVDDNLEEAKDILSYTIDKMRKDGLSYSSPQSVHKMFLAQVAKEHSK